MASSGSSMTYCEQCPLHPVKEVYTGVGFGVVLLQHYPCRTCHPAPTHLLFSVSTPCSKLCAALSVEASSGFVTR